MEKIKACAVNAEVIKSPREALEMIEKVVKSSECDLVVFPELFVKMGEEDIENFEKIAKSHGIHLVFGAKYEENGKKFNRAFLFHPDGRVDFYDKIHLTSEEKEKYARGKVFKVFETEFGKLGIAICFDLLFPEAFRTLRLKGAEIIALPAAWAFFDSLGWEMLTRVRCRENQVFGVFANAKGMLENKLRLGRSRIIDPFGFVISNAPPSPREFDLAIAELNPEVLEWASGKNWPKEDYLSKRVKEAYLL